MSRTIVFEHRRVVDATPERVFGLLDDLPATARWLPPCIALEKVGEGGNRPGDRLRYVYRQGRTQGEMEGVIVDREPGRRLHCRYDDPMFEVAVDLAVEPEGDGAAVVQRIGIMPKTFVGRLMSPLIRVGLRKQTLEAAANLKRLLEEGRD